MSLSNKVYARVPVAEGSLAGKVRPEPDVFEDTGIQGRCFQKGLHEALESFALVAFGKGYGTVFCQ